MGAQREAIMSVAGAAAACLVVGLVLAALAWLVKSWCTDVRKARAAADMARRYRRHDDEEDGHGGDSGEGGAGGRPPRSPG
jgi:hypothetical protein